MKLPPLKVFDVTAIQPDVRRARLGPAIVMAAITLTLAATQSFAQMPPTGAGLHQGVDRLKGVMDAIRTGDASQLSAQERAALASARASADKAAKIEVPLDSVTTFTTQAVSMEQLAREAFVAALPPRDQALGRNVILGDNTVPGAGKLYYFVSRSMPMNVLKAYAIDALYTGGTLVVKGVRKGDTLKDYIEEVVAEFNKADGNVLAGLEMNPNLFDMFGVTVVPTVVWTNRAGLDDIGSGCQHPDPENGVAPQIEVEGPDGLPIFAEKPTCVLAPASSYYKIAGVLNTSYVLDRFEAAGADRVSIAKLRKDLSKQSLRSAAAPLDNPNAMVPIDYDLSIQAMPPHVLADWAENLQTLKVQRTGWGPAFSAEGTDDAVYRAELLELIKAGMSR